MSALTGDAATGQAKNLQGKPGSNGKLQPGKSLADNLWDTIDSSPSIKR